MEPAQNDEYLQMEPAQQITTHIFQLCPPLSLSAYFGNIQFGQNLKAILLESILVNQGDGSSINNRQRYSG